MELKERRMTMSKAETFIQESTKIYSNKILRNKNESFTNIPCKGEYYPWLTPGQARQAVEIAKKEALNEVKGKLLNMLQTNVDNKQFFEQLKEYIKGE